jgi:hypothetical protein
MKMLEMEGTVAEIQTFLASLNVDRLHVTVSAVEPSDDSRAAGEVEQGSISERLLAMADEMPPEQQAQMPADLAEQHDHYVYGWSKR